MTLQETPRRKEIVNFLKSLRDDIISGFETLETTHQFQRKHWTHHSGGGGEISVIRGNTFEKAAVNWSGVWGDTFPMQDGSGPFFATGISLITHMTNPHAPTVHMNIRYIETADRFWFGGGYDLTPMGFPYEEDTEHFHNTAKTALNPFGNDNTGNFENDIGMWKNVGKTFLDCILPIYQRRVNSDYSVKEKERQQEFRAHYVEFNLLYDRGTRFGFLSGGNPEAILCSMPPTAKW